MSTRAQIAAAIAGLVIIGTVPARADGGGTPAYARQTGLACSACHTHFPELTATGRAFKLNGYVFRRSESLEGKTPEGQQSLLLNLVAPVSLMMQTSYTSTKKAQSGTQNGVMLFPDQLSLFTGG